MQQNALFACKPFPVVRFIIKGKQIISVENELLYRYLQGRTSDAEEGRIAAWLEENPSEHRKQLDAVRFIFEGVELYGTQPHAARRGVRIPLMRVTRYAVRIAAVVMLVLGTGYATYQHTYRTLGARKNIVSVPAGHRMELTLADGTQVWLNSGAKIEYPAVFARNMRYVKLSGEAMFQVRRDEKRPFIVETFASNVRVLGTKFNVNADEEHSRFTTALLEGSVRVSNRLDPSQTDIVMKPHDVVSLVDGRLQTHLLEDETSICWTQGLLYVTGLSFAELMDKFEQVFNVRIVIDRRTMPELGAVGGKIRVNAGVENALRLLQMAADFTYEIDEATDTVTIR